MIAEEIYNLTTNETIINWTIQLMNEKDIIIYNKTIQIWTLAILAITFLLFSIYKYLLDKKNKKQTEEWKQTQRDLRALIGEINKKKEVIKTKRIDISNLPQELKEELLNKEHPLYKAFYEAGKNGQPLLLLIRNNGNIEIKKNAKEGKLIIKCKDDKKEIKKAIVLKANKLLSMKYGGLITHNLKLWIAYEDEAESYPITPKHLSRSLYEIIESIQLTKGLLQPPKGKFPKWIIWAAVIILVLVIGYYVFFNKTTPPPETLNAINETINQTIQNETVKVIKIG